MPWFTIVLYLHLLAVITALAFAGYVHLGLERRASASTPSAALAALRLVRRGAVGLSWAVLALLLTGAALTQAAFTWTTPWIDVSFFGLLVLGATAILIALPYRRQPRPTATSLLRAASYLLPLLTLGILLVMILKPQAGPSTLLLFLTAAAAALLARHDPESASA